MFVCLFVCVLIGHLQVGLPHDDHDLYDWHVLPAGHAHRAGMEHVSPGRWQRERDTGTSGSLQLSAALKVASTGSVYRHRVKPRGGDALKAGGVFSLFKLILVLTNNLLFS